MKTKNYAVLTFLIVTAFSACQFQNATITEREITNNWFFKQIDSTIQGEAIVPGTVHTDLLNAKLIEDPFYRINEKNQQWIDKNDWEYSKTLIISPKEFEKDNIRLSFLGLDTYADVYFNDVLLLEADNMFREWEIDIKPYANEGENKLRVYFHSPINKGLELLKQSAYSYPASNDQSENGEIGDQKVSIFTRKAGYHYGWDWGPRLVTSGIWRPVVLKTWNSFRVKNTFIKQQLVSNELAELNAEITYETNEAFAGKITIKNNGRTLASSNHSFQNGVNKTSLPFTITNPKLWWSKGLGAPNLYEFEIIISGNNKLLHKQTLATGIRSIKLIREKDEAGESFAFELNGIPVFIKGANYIPNDNFLPRVTTADYEKVIADAVNANMNMLRVWGGGTYENDEFYELCDKNGLLVWQDFMFACSMYPGDSAFLESVKQEAIDNVTRLRNHPSIALWCGNNEINSAWSYYSKGGWGWKETYTQTQQEEIQKAYLDIFHNILPEVVANCTDGDDYWPSSPQAGYEPNEHAGYDNASGDMHYWGVWHGLHPFEDFDIYKARFMSEYGFQSFPDFETVQKYTVPEDYDIESDVMASHQRSGIGNLRIKEYMSWYFNVPENFEDFLYMSHVLQAYGMKAGIEAHRRAMPYCMGTLFWQINDCWPVASWSSTDYYHKWKAMHYAVKKAYEPVLLSGLSNNDTLSIFGISDLLNNIQANLKISLIDFSGHVIMEKSIETTLKANTSSLLYQFNKNEYKFSENNTALKIGLLVDNKPIADNMIYFSKPVDQDLTEANIQTKLIEKNGKWYVQITSDKLVRYVYLNFEGQNEFFTDNYFDLMPNETIEVEVENGNNLKIEELEIKHLGMISY